MTIVLIAREYDLNGVLIARATMEFSDEQVARAFVADQLQHLQLGLEISVFRGRRRVDLSMPDAQHPLAQHGLTVGGIAKPQRRATDTPNNGD